MSKKQSQLKSGVILNYLNMLLGMLIPFFYTPVMLRMLGQAEYGLYSLSNSVVSYLGLLSFGFGTTIIRYISKYRAEEDNEKLEKTYGFFFLLYMALGVLVIICGLILANNVETIFHEGLTTYEQNTMHKLVLIMTASTALSFPLSVFSSMISSFERYTFRGIIAIIMTAVCPIANLIALWMGYKSVGMAAAGLAIQVLCVPLDVLYCRIKLKIRLRFGRLQAGLVREMVSVSFYNFLSTLVNMLFWATDKVILGMLASSIAVAVYNVGATFCSTIDNISLAISGVLTPRVTGMVVKQASKDELTELFIKIGRLQFIVIGLVITGYIVFGRSFIHIWAGDGYSDAYIIALLVMIPSCIPLIENIGTTILIAQNKQKFRSLVYLAIAITNVISTYLLTPLMGAIGAALCTCVSVILGQGFAMNIYYHKVMKINIIKFWRTILKMAIVPLGMVVVGYFITKKIDFDAWIPFFIGVIIYTVIYIVLEARFVMNDYEKELILGPIIKLKNKILRKNK